MNAENAARSCIDKQKTAYVGEGEMKLLKYMIIGTLAVWGLILGAIVLFVQTSTPEMCVILTLGGLVLGGIFYEESS